MRLKSKGEAAAGVDKQPRKLFVISPQGAEPVLVPELVERVFRDADAREPGGWDPVFEMLAHAREQGAKDATGHVALARALVLCVALEARERDYFYPYLGSLPKELPQQRVAEYYGADGYGADRDLASLTSSFKTGYGPACAVLAAASMYAGREPKVPLHEVWEAGAARR